jgi:hypothetical protein
MRLQRFPPTVGEPDNSADSGFSILAPRIYCAAMGMLPHIVRIGDRALGRLPRHALLLLRCL